jgi:hypothetical protein
MGNQGDSQNTLLTYSSYKEAVYEGDQSNTHMGNPGVDMHLGKNFLASLKRVISNEKYASYEASVGVTPDATTGYIRTAAANLHKATYGLQFNAALNKALFLEKQTKKANDEFYASVGDNPAKGYAAMAKLAQLNASVPPGQQGSAAQKVGPLTQIPFIQDVLGIPNEQYWINELFTKVALPQLHAEQPEVDWIAPLMNLRPAQDVQNLEPDFDSHFFEALRTEVPFLIPREYRMRATIDPYNLYADASARALREGREAKSLLALSGLPSQGTIGDPSTSNAAGFPASQNNTKVELEGLFAQHWKDTRLMIDSCVIAPETFGKYESNFYTKGFAPYANIETWGLVNLPGFKRPIRCAISPFMQEDRYYFFNGRYAFTGEGPQVTESWAKPEKNSDAGAWRDYNDIVIFNPNRAGFSVTVEGTSPDAEITNIDEARALIAPPSDVLDPTGP